MRIVLLGAGGVGGYFGARLQQAGEDVVFLARGGHLRALRGQGLRLSGVSGELHLAAVAATDEPRDVGAVDAVLVAVKSWQLADAARQIPPLVGPQTVVVPLLNGVESATELAAALGSAPVAAGLCGIVAYLVAPGHVHHEANDPWVRFGEVDNRPSPRLERLREAFTRAGVRAEIPADIHAALWMKLLFIVAVSGVGALTRAPVGQWRHLAGARDLALRAMREVAAVAAARGVVLPADAVPRTLGFLDALAPGATSSLQRDFEAGRRTELDAQMGAILRLGAAAGVESPANRLLYDCLLPQELAARTAAAGS